MLVVEGKITKIHLPHLHRKKWGNTNLKKNQKVTRMHNKKVPKNNISK
jgi:hypothetical protein